MAQPSPYERIFSFTGVSTATPNAQQPGVQLDAEFNAVRTALNQVIANIALIQRDDTAIANATVGLDQFKAEVTPYFGVKGDTGDTGATGPTGPIGIGVPTGGTASALLRKVSTTAYDMAWSTTIYDNGSNIGIGTSTPFSFGAGYVTAHVNGTSGGVFRTSAGGTTVVADFYADVANIATIRTTTNTPLVFSTNSTERMKIDGTGNVLVTGIGGLGYGAGSGGAATQLTSRTTGVTVNKYAGQITLFSATTTAGQTTTMTVTNSVIALGDTVIVSQQTGTGIYFFSAKVAAGSFSLSVYTPAAVAVAEAPVLNFAVIKSVSA